MTSSEKKVNKDRIALLVIIIVVGIVVAVEAIDGTLTPNYIPVADNVETVVDSIAYATDTYINVEGYLYENGSRVCTSTNGICGSVLGNNNTGYVVYGCDGTCTTGYYGLAGP